MPTYVEGLVPRIRRILEGSDLSTISAKGVRKQLIAAGEPEDEIKTHKSEIDEIIGEIYEELCADDDEEEEDVKVKTKASASPAPPASSQPEPLARKPKTEDADAAMAARMQAEYDAAIRGGRGARRTAAPAPKKKAKGKKRKAADSDDDEPKKKRAGGGGGAFNKPMILSPDLATFTGEERLSRPQTVKALWAHIKALDLQDPSDKRFILCDDKMKSLFKQDRLHMFTMNKLLGEHLYNPDDVAGVKPEAKSEAKVEA